MLGYLGRLQAAFKAVKKALKAHSKRHGPALFDFPFMKERAKGRSIYMDRTILMHRLE